MDRREHKCFFVETFHQRVERFPLVTISPHWERLHHSESPRCE
jgi:hypothetical protein